MGLNHIKTVLSRKKIFLRAAFQSVLLCPQGPPGNWGFSTGKWKSESRFKNSLPLAKTTRNFQLAAGLQPVLQTTL
jgi:hypothetical protein